MFDNTIRPVNLFDTVIRLRAGGGVDATPRESLRDAAPADERVVVAFHADSDRAVHPDVWERHPTGQEVLCVLSGAIHVYLRDHGNGSQPVATVGPGEAFVVPPGAWHRLSVAAPGDLLSLTPAAGTEHELVTGLRGSHEQ